jgi:hypothetical protein
MVLPLLVVSPMVLPPPALLLAEQDRTEYVVFNDPGLAACCDRLSKFCDGAGFVPA